MGVTPARAGVRKLSGYPQTNEAARAGFEDMGTRQPVSRAIARGSRAMFGVRAAKGVLDFDIFVGSRTHHNSSALALSRSSVDHGEAGMPIPVSYLSNSTTCSLMSREPDRGRGRKSAGK